MRGLAILCLLAAVGCAGGDDDGGGGGGGGDDGGDGDSATDGAPPIACDDEPEHAGEGTYYDADGTGNCSFDASPDDLMVAAMNQVDYDDSAACGACAAVDGPAGSVTVRIVDRCPECPQGDLDLSPQAFEQIAELSAGRVPIAWRYVACEVDGPVSFHFKDGTNPFWTAIQVRDHRFAVASLEARLVGGDWTPIARENYNYFVQADGLGEGPFDLRVTDVHGEAIENIDIVPDENVTVAGDGQFPACE